MALLPYSKEVKYLAELKLISPLLSNMEVVKNISIRGGTSVYLVRSTRTQQTYILKHISIPESQKQVDALLYTGAAASKEDAQKYYEQVVSDYQSELETLEKLSSSPNLDCYRSYQIAPKEDGVGYDVYLLAEDHRTLVDYLAENAVTHLTALNLGLDLCNALIDLRAAGLIHRDVKPSNIYLSTQGHFVLGDLGIAQIDELKYCSMPEHMLSSYSAPELFELVGSIDKTTDIYSVGLILYRIFNANHGPFEDETTSARAADKRRATGEALPAPMYADYEMAEIILKACAFAPADRYQTPDELKNALMEYARRNQVEDTLIVPPIVADPEPIDTEPDEDEAVEPVQFADAEQISDDFKESFSPDTDMLNSIIESVHRDFAKEEPQNPILNSLEDAEDDADADEDDVPAPTRQRTARRKKRSKTPLILLAVLALVLAAIAAAYFLFIAPATITVDGITVLDRTSTAVTVRVDSPEKDGAFAVICADAYGSISRQGYVKGSDNCFTELVPGTQYTVSVEALHDEKINGDASVKVTTIFETNILSFTATPVSVTQCELNLTLNGPDPGLWTVRYASDVSPEQTVSFSGHTTTIAGLQSNTEYTFTLVEPEGTHLTGVTEATFSTVPSVDIEKLTAAVSSSSALLSWTYTGDAPEYWTVSINGPDGYTDSQVVTAPTATFEGLTSGVDYEVVISAPTMLQDGKAVITPMVTTLTSFSVTENDAHDGYQVQWTCETEPAEDNWTLRYQLKGVPSAEPVEVTLESPDGYTIPAEGLVPDAEYEVKLSLANGEVIEGVDNELTFHTAAAEKFKRYGFDKVYIGMYLLPTGEDWGVSDLKTARSKYTTDEQLAFALESTVTLQQSTDSVQMLLVVRDADGKLVDASATEAVWNDMWQQRLTTGSFPRPITTAGSYTLEVYFDGLFVIAQNFTVE